MITQLKLGKRPAKHDPRTLRLAAYLPAELPPIPQEHAWSPAVDSWPMFRNDTVGDCTCAGAAHQIRTWTGNENPPSAALTDADVIAMYAAVTGYNEADPSTDQGAYLLDVLKYWRSTGIASHKIAAFAQVPLKEDLVRAAIYLFGGLYVGLLLPISAQEQAVWDVETTAGDGQPGSWGGHCVVVIDYDADGLTCVTWGELRRMTWAFFATYCDEAYAIVSPDWIQDEQSPSGLDLAALQADLAQVSGQAPVTSDVAMRLSPGVCGEIICDTWATISASKAIALKATGVAGVIRYLDNLTKVELAGLLAAGLKVGFVSSCRGTGWIPSRAVGENDGKAAIAKLQSLGVLKGAHDFADCEGMGGSGRALLDYLNARGAVLEGAGYPHAEYEGWGHKTNPYAAVGVHGYWAAGAIAEPRPACGWFLLQLLPFNQTRGGVIVDLNVVQKDAKGRVPVFVAAA